MSVNAKAKDSSVHVRSHFYCLYTIFNANTHNTKIMTQLFVIFAHDADKGTDLYFKSFFFLLPLLKIFLF